MRFQATFCADSGGLSSRADANCRSGETIEIVPPIPLLIVFAPGSRLFREQDRPSDLPMHRSGPPGTFVLLPNLRVSLPTDQIVFADASSGAARVGFGGFRFDGVDEGRLMFSRIREMLPDDQLSPTRSFTMILQPEWVASIDADGVRVWP